MRAGEGGVTTQVNFDCRGEPAKIIAVFLPVQESSFGEVHFSRYILHPAYVLWLGGGSGGGRCGRRWRAAPRVWHRTGPGGSAAWWSPTLREVLIRSAPAGIFASSASPISSRVASVRGRCRLTIVEDANRSSSEA